MQCQTFACQVHAKPISCEVKGKQFGPNKHVPCSEVMKSRLVHIVLKYFVIRDFYFTRYSKYMVSLIFIQKIDLSYFTHVS